MSDKPIQTIDLSSGRQVEFYDDSEKVAADRYMVRLRLRMEIPVSEEKQSILGTSVHFEQVRERIFVPIDQKTKVLKILLDVCVSYATQYLAHPDFVPRYLD